MFHYINSFPELSNWALLVDYNQDFKADLFTSSNSSIALYTNNSENELSFNFTKILTSDAGFGPINLYVSGSDIPAIVDVDGDEVDGFFYTVIDNTGMSSNKCAPSTII